MKRSVPAVLLVVVAVASACGSSVDRRALRAANHGIDDPALVAKLGRAGGSGSTGAQSGSGIDGAVPTGAAAGGAPQPAGGEGAGSGATSSGSPGATGGATPARAGATSGAAATGAGAAGGSKSPSGAGTAPGTGRPTAQPGGSSPGGGTPGAGAGAPGGSAPVTAAKSPIKVGSFGTQSGPIGLILANAVAAVRAWVADVNARGGLNGHSVQLILADDGGDPGKALAIARRMVEEEKVLAFYGLFGAATQHTTVPYLEQQKVPVIGSVPHPAIEYSPVFFAPETTNIELNRGHLSALRAMSQVTKLSLMACREADSCPKAIKDMKDYAAKLNFTVAHEATVSLAQPDYTAEVLAARNAGAQAVVLVLDVQSVVRFLRSAKRQEWNPLVLGGPAVYEQAFLESGGALTEGTMLFATTLPYSASPRMAPYREAVARHVPGGKLGDFGAGLWLGGKLFERIAPALGEPPTRQQIFDALHSLRAETLGGLTPPLEFPPVRSATTNHCVVPVRVEGGKYIEPNGDTFVCNVR
jgi:branched-chain amino acid transport system substrate-binding protein